jgi:rare lipoprotein A (peptidoglycan hydrolase)
LLHYFDQFPPLVDLIHATLPVDLIRLGFGKQCKGQGMKTFFRVVFTTALLITVSDIAHAATASIYGGRDGLCGHKTASGERLNCTAMTAAHRRYPFGTQVRVCHDGCVTVRINDRGPWVRTRDIDLSPAAAHAIGLEKTGYVTLSVEH